VSSFDPSVPRPSSFSLFSQLPLLAAPRRTYYKPQRYPTASSSAPPPTSHPTNNNPSPKQTKTKKSHHPINTPIDSTSANPLLSPDTAKDSLNMSGMSGFDSDSSSDSPPPVFSMQLEQGERRSEGRKAGAK